MSEQPHRKTGLRPSSRMTALFMAAAIGVQAVLTAAPGRAQAKEDFDFAAEQTFSCIQHISNENVRRITGFRNLEDIRVAAAFARYLEDVEKRDTSAVRAILDATAQADVDFRIMLVQGMIESDLGRVVQPSWVKTSMRGLYQYHPYTWMYFFKQFGGVYGRGQYKHLADAVELDENGYADIADAKIKKQVLDLRLDHSVAAFIKAMQMRYDDTPKLQKILGRAPNLTDYYIFYFLGEGDARKFFKNLQENPGKSAASVLAKPARYNRPLFYESKEVTESVRVKKKGKKPYYVERTVTKSVPLSFEDLYEKIEGRLEKRLNRALTASDKTAGQTECIIAPRRGVNDTVLNLSPQPPF